MSTLIVIYGARQHKVKTTPGMLLAQVLSDACIGLALGDSASFVLMHGTTSKKPVDLATPVRLSGLANNAKLLLERRRRGPGKELASVTLQCVAQSPVEAELACDLTLWHALHTLSPDVLQRTDATSGVWLAPTVTILNKRFVGVDALLGTPLQAAGVAAGRNLIRIGGFEATDLTLAHLHDRVAKEAQKSPPPQPEPELSPRTDADASPISNGPSDAVVAAFAAQQPTRAVAEPAPVVATVPTTPVVDVAAAEATAASSSSSSSVATAATAVPAAEAPKEVEVPTSPAGAPPPPFVEDASLNVQRNLRVWGVRALQSAGRREAVELPDEFYEVTPDDLKAAQSTTQKRKQMDEQLMTRDMRERHKKRYLATKLRVKMPDRIEIEGTFSVLETIGDVVQFVREQLRDAALPFYLFVTPPRTVLSEYQLDATLGELELVPAAVIMLAFGTPRAPAKVEQPFLKAELMASLTEHDFVDLSSVGAAEAVAPEEPAARSANEKLRAIMDKLRGSKKTEPRANDDDDDDADDKAAASASASATASKIPKWLKLSKPNKK
jgi:tether containing UBX domain for GLUT4